MTKTRLNRNSWRRNDSMRVYSYHNCDNCGELTREGQGHYVPPCFGDPGFYHCDTPSSELNNPNLSGN